MKPGRIFRFDIDQLHRSAFTDQWADDVESRWVAHADPEVLFEYLAFARDADCPNRSWSQRLLYMGTAYLAMHDHPDRRRITTALIEQARAGDSHDEVRVFADRAEVFLLGTDVPGFFPWLAQADPSGTRWDVRGERLSPPPGTTRDPGSAREDFEAKFPEFDWRKEIKSFARGGFLSVPFAEWDVDTATRIGRSMIDYLQRSKTEALCCICLERYQGKWCFEDLQFPVEGEATAHYELMLDDAEEHRDPLHVGVIFPPAIDFALFRGIDGFGVLAGHRAVLEEICGSTVEQEVAAFGAAVAEDDDLVGVYRDALAVLGGVP